MYVSPVEPTHPGTEIKVTPDSDAPIIPIDTIYQGDCLFPLKKVSLSAFLLVKNEMRINTPKYPAIIAANNAGLMLLQFYRAKIVISKDIHGKNNQAI